MIKHKVRNWYCKMKCPFCELRGESVELIGKEGSRMCPKCFVYEVNKDNYNLSRKERGDLNASKRLGVSKDIV